MTAHPAPPTPSPSPPATRRAVAVRHLLFEDLGILHPLLIERGYAVEYLDAGIDDLDTATIIEADLLVVLGGPVAADDADRYPFLHVEADAIAARLRARRPTLGICLGAQLVARALGAQVHPLTRPEIGYAKLTLTAHGQDSPLRHLDGVPVLHWHGDQFDIPDQSLLLASTPQCPHQAFTAGPHVLALQFHLETSHHDLERWLIGHAESLAALGLHPASLRRDAAQTGPALQVAATQVLADWLDIQVG